jgi:deazaflavin-dependent oxidoreductase (nitroreductase family)
MAGRCPGTWSDWLERPPSTQAPERGVPAAAVVFPWHLPSITNVVDYLSIADRSWPILGPLMRGHAAVYRATGGRIGQRMPGLPSLLLLDHVGGKTGKRRTTPLVYMPDGDDFVVVASKGGYPNNPGWLHNLRAHPRTEIQIGRQRIGVRAREASDEERRMIWPRAVEHNPHWARYQLRTGRKIPIVILRPARKGEPAPASQSRPS